MPAPMRSFFDPDRLREVGDQIARRTLANDGWSEGKDGRWRNRRFNGAFKRENALKLIGKKDRESHDLRMFGTLADGNGERGSLDHSLTRRGLDLDLN